MWATKKRALAKSKTAHQGYWVQARLKHKNVCASAKPTLGATNSALISEER